MKLSVGLSDGFTLVEMLVVLGLVALLLMISLPYATSSGGQRELDATAQVVAAKLREAQTSSLSANRERSLTVDPEKRRLLQTGPDRTFQMPLDIKIAIITSSNEVVEGSGAFRFFPDSGSTGGKIILSSGNSRREIAINWLTGAVVISSGESP